MQISTGLLAFFGVFGLWVILEAALEGRSGVRTMVLIGLVTAVLTVTSH